MVGIYDWLLPFYECRWGGACTCWWWGYLNTTLCNQTYLNFLSPSMVGPKNLVYTTLAHPHTPSYILAPLAHPPTPLHTPHTWVWGCARVARVCKDMWGLEGVWGCARVVRGARMCKGCEGCDDVLGVWVVQGSLECVGVCKDVQGCVRVVRKCKGV